MALDADLGKMPANAICIDSLRPQGPRSDKPYVALINEVGFHVFEFEDATEVRT